MYTGGDYFWISLFMEFISEREMIIGAPYHIDIYYMQSVHNMHSARGLDPMPGPLWNTESGRSGVKSNGLYE